MRIMLTLEVPDDLADSEDSTGLTEAAFINLTSTLSDLGYEFASGPDRMGE